MTYQSPMKRFRSTRRSIARKGGLESEPKNLDHDSQPEKSVASAANNKDRPATLPRMVIGPRLFAFILTEMI